ncbi:MAG: TolC family protein [Bacteroidales bacterium]|nr:TolC family protein [Bacteroidales bacterium]
MTKTIRLLMAFVLLSTPCTHGQEIRQMSMAELFTLANRQNPDIGAADAKIAAARQGEAVAKNALLPQISASLTLSYLGDGTVLDRDFGNAMRDRLPHFSNSLSVELYQPLYTGGAISSGVRLAEKDTEMAINNRTNSVNSIRMAIATNYLELAKHRNLIQVYEENIRLTEKLLAAMKAKHSQGIVLKNDITRYELRRSSLSYDSLATANAIRIFNKNLVSLLGLEAATEIIPDIEADGSLIIAGDANTWIESAVANSPSLKSLDILTGMSSLNRKIAHSEYIPKIGLVAGDNFLGPVTFEVPALNKNYNAWFVGVNVKWNISSLFTTPKSTRKHDLELARIQRDTESVTAEIERRISEAATLYRQSIERLEIERKNVQLAEGNYAVVSNRFNNQLSLLTDMLDASNARLDAGVRLVNAEISTRFYYYQLHYIAGTLSTL